MEKPEVVTTIGGFEFHWHSQALTIIVNRLNVHNDGRVTGELIVKSLNDSGKSIVIYPPTSFNFSSDRTRTGLVKTLSAKFKDSPWGEMIDQVCFAVQDRCRRGEDVQELWTNEDIEAPEYLVQPILMKGIPTVLFGEKGVNKSRMALVWYAILTLPWIDNPLGFIAPIRSIKTLILDWEVTGNIAQWNAQQLQRGMNLPHFPLYHRKCSLPLADDIEAIEKWVHDMKAEVVIIDSLARACGGELSKDTSNANRFFVALEKLNVTSLIIAQTSKDKEAKQKTIYGNVLFTYFARSIFELCLSQEVGEDVLDVALFHRWSNLTKLQRPMSFRISFNGNGTLFERQAMDYIEFKEKLTGQAAVIAYLNDGPKTIPELAAELQWKEESVRPLMSSLKRKGKVTNLGKGLWGLTEKT